MALSEAEDREWIPHQLRLPLQQLAVPSRSRRQLDEPVGDLQFGDGPIAGAS